MSSKTKKAISMLLVVALIAVIAVGGMLAYLVDSDDDVNVMTLGNVKIEQMEYERGENGEFKEFSSKLESPNKKPLYPAVGTPTWASYTDDNYKFFADTFKNVQDKIVTVKNTGSTAAFVRTIFAFETADLTWEEFDKYIGINVSDSDKKSAYECRFEWIDGDDFGSDNGVIEVEGVKYRLAVATYISPLAAGAETKPSLRQVYLAGDATNEICEKFGEEYSILVASQAVQAAGFESEVQGKAVEEKIDAEKALETAFYVVSKNNHPWLNGAVPAKVSYNNKAFGTLKEAVDEANKNGGGTIKISGTHEITEPLPINSAITLAGDNATIKRGGDYTGTMFSVTGSELNVENVTLDGTGVTATGNLIAAGQNGRIVLNKGAVLQNNHGAHAVNLGTRIGATLTLNGGEIINNSSDSGAIWGGGHITINSGKINNNSSTGSAGAIRMVSNCNLTMNGGEICRNKAAGDGGAIWGYGSSTYNFSGGKMSDNESAGVGGAIYTGTNSVINIGGDFEMCDNKAINSGAIRLTDHTSMNMTDGKVSGNTQNGESNAFNTWNNSISITGGTLDDNMSYVGGLGLTIGKADINGVINYALSTNHNTAYLAADFNGFKFKVDETNANFANFNFKPATGYTYTAGDEAKLVCMNEGYKTYWDAGTGTFRLQAK